jgi:hypothetical protein
VSRDFARPRDIAAFASDHTRRTRVYFIGRRETKKVAEENNNNDNGQNW